MSFLGKSPAARLHTFVDKIDGRKAYLQDPQYHAQVSWMQRFITTMDLAMEAEDIDQEKRARVTNAIIFGAPDPAEGERRAKEQMQRIETAALGLPEPKLGFYL